MKKFLLIGMLAVSFVNAQEQQTPSIEVNEQKEPCLQTITGQIRDQITNELISNTIVTLTDAEGNPIQTLMATEDATFTFTVDCDNTYKLTASKESYNPQSTTFTTSNDSGLQLETKILLDQGRIDFIVDPAKETKSNDVASISTETNMESVAIKESISAAIPVNNEKEETVVEDTSKETKEEKKEESKPIVTSDKKIETTKNAFGEDILVLKPVIFDYESSYLNQQAKKDLLNVAKVLKKNPNIVLECASYTDAKGTEKYNLWMSQRRAKRTVDYLIRRGISPNRITARGYGESKLINDCTDDCTDQERAVNRRTEFKIIKK